MKKVLSLVLVVLMVMGAALSMASCSKEEKEVKFEKVAKEDLKIGMITLHDETSTYDKNFIDAMYRALDELGLKKEQLVLYTGIEESTDCYDKAKACVNEGCQVVFADSFGHEDYMIQAAQEYKSVRFCHATGTKADIVGLKNYSNAFAAIYEGRYLAGITAGMKLNEMIAAGKITAEQAVMGYVGAFTYAEVVSGYTSFYLGAKSVCPSVTMKVKFTGSWFNTDKEYTAAKALIEQENCVLISQHADSYGAPTACEEAKVPNVSYNGSTAVQGPNTYITYSQIDWTPYFVYMIQCVMDAEVIKSNWTGTIATGSVKVGEISAVAAEGTQAKLDEALAGFKAGTLKVFDTSKDNYILVGGKKLESFMVDFDGDKEGVKETEVIKDGYFHESEFRSAPYFDVEIDGITLLDRVY